MRLPKLPCPSKAAHKHNCELLQLRGFKALLEPL